ncbi:MAG: DUF1638 domain-containing protein [Ilumatobacteraceae bacterium]
MAGAPTTPRTLVIACGALARELLCVNELNGLDNVTIECLPASLHNRPSEIPDAVRARIRRARGEERLDTAETGAGDSPMVKELAGADLVDGEVRVGAADFGTGGSLFDRILIGYADCGTGGLLDRVCEEEGVERLPGAHCYEFFATGPRFEQLQDHALGSFYLTDFLVKHFDRLVWQGLGLDRHPELLPMYFGNYTRLVYLAQTDDPGLEEQAVAAAERLGLELDVERTGYGELESTVVEFTRRPERASGASS